MRLPPKPDGCTWWPDKWTIDDRKYDLTEDCDAHDLDYEAGNPRRQSDRKLRDRIASKGMPVLAWVMYVGVRLFGWMRYG